MSALRARYDELRSRIRIAEEASNRISGSVKLVAVSKGHPASAIAELYELGHRVFGESYAQELDEKARALRSLEEIQWHFIGHLQTNKAKLVAAHASAVHALDSERAVATLDRHVVAKGAPSRVRGFVAINFGLDQKEHGVPPADSGAVVAALRASKALEFGGFMTLPPDEPQATEKAFCELRRMRDEIDQALDLSMGMSSDLELAIRYGATYVRVGTALFGER